MLKIVIVTNNYKPYSGGVVSSIDSYTDTLRKLGHQVFIVTYDFLNQGDCLKQGLYTINTPIRFKYKKNIMCVPWRANQRMLQILACLKPDIVHSQHPFLLGSCALKACKKLNIPIVFTHHTQYDQYLHYCPLPEILTKPVLQKVIKKYCNLVNAIVSPSKLIKKYLIDKKIQTSIEVIPSGVLPVFIMQEFQEKKGNQKFKLLTVSRFVKEKNIEFLLEAFTKLDSSKFEFQLIGYGAHLDSLKNYAYNILKLDKKTLQFIEKPSKQELTKYYRDADLFIFSSKTETQGLVLAEAMANGTPVVALDAAGSNEIIKNNFNGFLIHSQSEMAEKINIIFNNEELFKHMQFNAWQTSQNYYPINTTNKLLHFYNQIIALQ